MKDTDCIDFLQWALPRLHLRWRGFRRVRRQVCKRISRRMAELGLTDASSYRGYLECHDDEWARLDGFCWISISRFYRDRGVYDFLGQEVLPALIANRRWGARELWVWSVGCASGEEPYGLALVWHFVLGPAHPNLDLRIVATDVDPVLLERARRACYPQGTLKELPLAWRDRAFEERNGRLCLRAAFRGAVRFRRQDLRLARPKERFDLVLCRNLAFTYFDEGVQRKILERIGGALRPGGALVLGRHERLPEGAAGFAPWSAGHRVYRRAA
ncbi:MAG: CheR family methyltransferase [Alphaproteobacteria bacterium]